MREASAYALGEIKDQRAIEALILILNDSHFNVKDAVIRFLRKITGIHFDYNINKWIEWWEKNKYKFLK